MGKIRSSSFKRALKSGSRTQYAALCYRMKQGKPQFLMITSRRTKRWIIPKGWQVRGSSPSKSAAIEAWEEAGATGKISKTCIGMYSYKKFDPKLGPLPCAAMIFPLKVKAVAKKFPEAGQRKRKWLSRKKAAAKVNEPDLARVIMSFDPQHIEAMAIEAA